MIGTNKFRLCVSVIILIINFTNVPLILSADNTNIIPATNAYQLHLKQLDHIDKQLDITEYNWKTNFQTRYEHYNSTLDKLKNIDDSLKTNTDTASIQKDYKYVVAIWRSFAENSFANISGLHVEKELTTTLVTYEDLQIQNILSDTEKFSLEKRYQNIKNRYASYTENYEKYQDKDQLYYNKVLLYSGKLRSKIYKLLSKTDESLSIFSQDNIQDLFKEIQIIPIRWSATFYSKILEFKDHVSAGQMGYVIIMKESLILIIFILSIICIAWTFSKITNVFEENIEFYLRRVNNRLSWPIHYLLNLLNKITPSLFLYLIFIYIEKLLVFTSFKECNVLIPYIEYYIIYRVILIFTSYTITKMKVVNIINLTYAEHIKLYNCLNDIFKFMLVNIMILHTISTIVGQAMVYNAYYYLLLLSTAFYYIYLIDRWRLGIYRKSVELLSSRCRLLFKYHLRKPYAPLVSTIALLTIIIIKIYHLSLRIVRNSEYAQRALIQMYKVQNKSDDISNLDLHSIPARYSNKFLEISKNLIPTNESTKCLNYINQWLKGQSDVSSILLYGPSSIGKTSIMKIIKHNVATKYIRISTKMITSSSIESLLRKLVDSNDSDKDGTKIVILIDDIHNLFLSTYKGFDAVQTLFEIINSKDPNIFWVVSCQHHAWIYLSKALELSYIFDINMAIQPWNHNRIKDMIMNQHKSMKFDISFDDAFFSLEKDNIKDATNYMQNKFFNLLKIQANGVPGLAISLWLKSLKYDGKNAFNITPILKTDTVSIVRNNLSKELLFIFLAIIKHKYLSLQEIQKVTNFNENTILNVIKPHLKEGVILKDNISNYYLNVEYEYIIEQILKKQNYVY